MGAEKWMAIIACVCNILFHLLLMKQNITDAGYQTETGAEKLMIMKHKQAIV